MVVIGFVYELGCSPKTVVLGVFRLLEVGGSNLNPKSTQWNNLLEGWLFQPLQNTPLSVQIRERTSTIKGNSSNLLAKTRYTHAKEASMVFWASELCRFWMPKSFYAPAISGQQFEALRGLEGLKIKCKTSSIPASFQISSMRLVRFGILPISFHLRIHPILFGQSPKPC